MKLQLFVLIFLTFTLSTAIAYQKCAAVSNSYITSMDGYNATASYKFLLFQNQGKSFVNVTDINVSIPGVKILYTCVMVNTIQYSCFESLPNSTIFLSENSTISVMTVFKESVMDEEIINLGGGIFDEGSFNDITGREYSVESPCISYTGKICK